MMKENKLAKSTVSRNLQTALLGFLAGLLFMTASFTCGSLLKGISAAAQAEQTDYKYYTSVRIASGDTLYSIAERYYSNSYYDNLEDYLKEVCRTNYIDDRDSLKAGEYIIMPYYAAYVAYEGDLADTNVFESSLSTQSETVFDY